MPSSYATSNSQRRTNPTSDKSQEYEAEKVHARFELGAAQTKSTWPIQVRWLQPQFARTVDLPILWTRTFRRVQHLHSVKSSSNDTAQDHTEWRSPRSRDYPSPNDSRDPTARATEVPAKQSSVPCSSSGRDKRSIQLLTPIDSTTAPATRRPTKRSLPKESVPGVR